MAEILLFVLVITLIVVSYRIIRTLSKRIFLILKLRELKKDCGATVKYNSTPFRSLFRFSKEPEITVEIGESVYLIRLISAKSKLHRVHFANPEFTVTAKGRLKRSGIQIATGATHFRRRAVVRVKSVTSTKIGKVRLLPKLNIPDESLYRGKTVVPVLIFNPAPHDVTYVSPEKTRVLAAFTGDKVYDHLIFTASTFVTYADRCEREAKEKRRSSSYWDEYFS